MVTVLSGFHCTLGLDLSLSLGYLWFDEYFKKFMLCTQIRPLTKPGSDCLDRIGSDSGSDRIGLRIGLVSSLLVQKNYFDKSCFNNDTGGSE